MNVCVWGGGPLIRGKVRYDIIKEVASNCVNVNIVCNGEILTEGV